MGLTEIKDGIPEGHDYRLITTEEQLDELCKEIANAQIIGVDTETEGLDYEDVIVGICISTAPYSGRYIPLRHAQDDPEGHFSVPYPDQLDPTLVFSKLGPLLEAIPSTGHNVKFDLKMFWKEGVAPLFKHDTLIQATLMGTYGPGERGLKHLTRVELGHEMKPLESLFKPTGRKKKPDIKPKILSPQEIFIYGCEDADYSLRLYHHFQPMLRQAVPEQLYKLEMDLLYVVGEMEAIGVPVDVEFLKSMGTEAASILKKLNQDIIDEIRTTVGEPELEINFNSTKQLGEILFNKLNLPITKRTASGAPSTSGDVLADLAKKFPLVARIHTYRILTKLHTAFLTKNVEHTHADGRIRGQFNQLGTASGRFSSRDPNLQQIPKDQTFYLWPVPEDEVMLVASQFNNQQLKNKKDEVWEWEAFNPDNEKWGDFYIGESTLTDEDGRVKQYGVKDGKLWEAWKCKTRKFIAGSEGHYIVEADYSQIELRVMAGESGEPTLLDAYRKADDVHQRTAGVIFGVPFEKVTKEQRHVGKTINFSLLYGAGPHKISETLNMPLDECKGIVDRYFQNLPQILTWINRKKSDARVDGFAKTNIGRIRYFPNIRSAEMGMRAKEEREAVNHHIQGAAADVMKTALVRIHKKMKKHFGHGVKIVCTVHDSVILEVENDIDPADVVAVLKAAMEFKMPGTRWPKLEVDVGVGPSWGDSEGFKLPANYELPPKMDLTDLPKLRVREIGREREGMDHGIQYFKPFEQEEPEPVEEHLEEKVEDDFDPNADIAWILEIHAENLNQAQYEFLQKFMAERKSEESKSTLTVIFNTGETKQARKAKGYYRISFKDEMRLKMRLGKCTLRQDRHNFDVSLVTKKLNSGAKS